MAISATEQATWDGVLQGYTVGGEALVNTTTAGTQQAGPALNAKSVAIAPDGSYVVVWAGNGTQAGNVDNSGVFFQRYNAAGVKQGSETLVNQTTANVQQSTAVAMDANGNFVATWTSTNQDGSNTGVYARLYNSGGTATGNEFLVNTSTTNAQQNPSVARNPNGDFVIAWAGNGTQAGNVDNSGVFFQRFNAAGVKQGSETLVNTTTAGNQQNASVTIDPNGNFVIAWDGNGAQAGNVDGAGVFFQRYNAAGVKQGSETLVNTTTAGAQQNGSVAMDANGNFVIAWDGNGAQAGNVDGAGVFFQRYNAAGVKQGSETLANQTTANTQNDASIAMDANGNFVVTWVSTSQPGETAGTTAVVKRDFNTDGTPNGGETIVNATFAGNQSASSVAMNAYDQYVVAWQGNGAQAGNVDNAGVFSQRYAAAVIVDTASDVEDGTVTSISALLNNRGADGKISLREAIDATNNTANTGAPDRIYFRIPAAGVQTISVTSALPTIADAVIIDGTTQPGFSGTPLIELNGTAAGGAASGLILGAGSSGSTIRGLVIDRFTGSAIRILGSSNNTVAGNFLGTNAAGTAALGNQVGVYITNSSTNNTVGGATVADRNVISGNTVDGVQIFGGGTLGNVVIGNYIGVDVTGTADLGNTNQGVAVFNQATNNTIGGTAAGAGNVISGNNGNGIGISTVGATGNVVQGNLIGTNAAGTAGIGNSLRGILIDVSAANNTVGGTAAGAGNTIAYNTLDGVALGSTAGTGNSIRGNAIFSNGGLGIDLAANGVTPNDTGDGDTGANNLQNFPVLTSALPSGTQITVAGTLNSNAGRSYRIEFFASGAADPTGYGEGQRYLGFTNVTTDASGNASISTTLIATVSVGELVSATATDLTTNDTSEFGKDIIANNAPSLSGANNLTSTLEDPASNSGTLVSSLISGKVTDADSGALSGIAVSAVDNSNGAWQYSTNGGSTWNNFGSPTNATARLLAADANTYVRFVPNANWNGTVAGGITFRAWDQTSGTAGSTADTSTNGGSTPFSTATASGSITVTSVNDAPGGTNNTVTTLEDTQYTFAAVDFGFTDPNDSPANNLTAVKISTIPGAGTLALSGVAVTAGQTVSVANIAAGNLKFTPAANANGAAYAAFTFQVQDDGGTANGGVDLDQSPNTMTVNVTAVNDAPAGTNKTVTTLEDTAYTFASADFGFTDPNDSPANRSRQSRSAPSRGRAR